MSPNWSRQRIVTVGCVVAVACACSAAVAGCGSSGSGGGAGASASSVKSDPIEYIGTGVSPYNSAIENELKAKAKAQGLNFSSTQSNDDPSKDVANWQTAMAKGVKGLIVDPVDSHAIAPIATQAANQGLCIAAIITEPGTNQSRVYPGLKAYVGWNDRDGGMLAGEELAKSMGGHGGVVVIRGAQGNLSENNRQAGAEAALKKYPGIKVLGVNYAEYDEDKAYSVMQDFLQRYGTQLKGVLTIVDQMAVGEARAVQAAGRKDIKIVSFGASKQGVQYIRKGLITASVPFGPATEADVALQQVQACLRGNKTPVYANEKQFGYVQALAPSLLVTPSTAAKFKPQW